MAEKDPFTYETLWPKRNRNMNQVLKRAEFIGPHLGVTQGGSSRKDPGCKPAATRGVKQALKRNEHEQR